MPLITNLYLEYYYFFYLILNILINIVYVFLRNSRTVNIVDQWQMLTPKYGYAHS